MDVHSLCRRRRRYQIVGRLQVAYTNPIVVGERFYEVAKEMAVSVNDRLWQGSRLIFNSSVQASFLGSGNRSGSLQYGRGRELPRIVNPTLNAERRMGYTLLLFEAVWSNSKGVTRGR